MRRIIETACGLRVPPDRLLLPAPCSRPRPGMKEKVAEKLKLIWTVGHSTQELEAFICPLTVHKVTCVADVRTVLRSRHNPQFNKGALPHFLRAAGIAYEYLCGLGGLGHGHTDSANLGWLNASLRGYADYMQTAEF